MGAKILHLPNRRPKANGQPEAHGELLETRGDEIAIFLLHDTGDATAWVSPDIQTRERWNYVLDLLDQIRDGLLRFRDNQGN